jgi:hypothetical protein
VTHLTSLPTDVSSDGTYTLIRRKEKLASPDESTDTGEVDEDASDVELVAPADNTVLPTTKVDFETGEVVSKGERWGDQVAFTLCGNEVTK